MSADLESARRDWDDGYRQLVKAAGSANGERLHRQVDVVTEELRRRVGATFTLEELASAYGSSDTWAREAIQERAATPGFARTLAVAVDASFHLYARGAVDYVP